MLNVGGIIHVLRGYWRSWVWAELTALQRKARGTANMIMRAERGSFVYVRELLRILPASESSSQISLKCPQQQIHYWVWTFGMYRHMYPKKKKKNSDPSLFLSILTSCFPNGVLEYCYLELLKCSTSSTLWHAWGIIFFIRCEWAGPCSRISLWQCRDILPAAAVCSEVCNSAAWPFLCRQSAEFSLALIHSFSLIRPSQPIKIY